MGVNFDKAMARFRETFREVDTLSRLVLYSYHPSKVKQPKLWWEVQNTNELRKALKAFYQLDASLEYTGGEFPDIDYDSVKALERLHIEFAKLYQQSLDIDPELEKWHAALKELQRVYGEFIGIRDMR